MIDEPKEVKNLWCITCATWEFASTRKDMFCSEQCKKDYYDRIGVKYD